VFINETETEIIESQHLDRNVIREMRIHYSKTQSIHSYLDLLHRPWYVEFGCEDFGASLSSLLELPISVYNNQAKEFFLAFIDKVLYKCSISFILRGPGHIDLAITGYWKKKKIAIPLWIMNDTLIGFEVIPEERQYKILDSFPLHWKTPVIQQTSFIVTKSETSENIVLDNDIFCGDTIYLKIEKNNLMIVNIDQSNDLKFFERIASVVIPEIDDE
jgi:hypothetical protein